MGMANFQQEIFILFYKVDIFGFMEKQEGVNVIKFLRMLVIS